MHTGADRPQGVVWHEVDVVRLCPSRHLQRFGKAAHIADVHSREVTQALLDVRKELPFTGELFPQCEGLRGKRTQRFVCFG